MNVSKILVYWDQFWSVKHCRILPTLNKSLAITIKLAGNVLPCHTVSPALFLFQLVLQRSGQVRRGSISSGKAVENNILQNFTFHCCEGGAHRMN